MESRKRLAGNVAALNSLLADIGRELDCDQTASESDIARLRELRQQCELRLSLLKRVEGDEPLK